MAYPLPDPVIYMATGLAIGSLIVLVVQEILRQAEEGPEPPRRQRDLG